MGCGKYNVKNPDHDYCYSCFQNLEESEEEDSAEDSFEEDLTISKIYTTYIMIYENKEKIGYTNDLNSRFIELKRKYPNNQLVYFREFVTESEARRFEAWLKGLTNRELNKFIVTFQDKVKKIKFID